MTIGNLEVIEKFIFTYKLLSYDMMHPGRSILKE